MPEPRNMSLLSDICFEAACACGVSLRTWLAAVWPTDARPDRLTDALDRPSPATSSRVRHRRRSPRPTPRRPCRTRSRRTRSTGRLRGRTRRSSSSPRMSPPPRGRPRRRPLQRTWTWLRPQTCRCRRRWPRGRTGRRPRLTRVSRARIRCEPTPDSLLCRHRWLRIACRSSARCMQRHEDSVQVSSATAPNWRSLVSSCRSKAVYRDTIRILPAMIC